MNITSIFGSLLCGIINIYLILIVIRIILSWLVLPPSRWSYYLNRLTDPVLDFAKKNFPVRIGIIDLSIIFPILFLTLLSKVINDLMVVGRVFSVFYTLEILIMTADILLSFASSIFIIIALVILIIDIMGIYTYNPLVTAFRSIIDPITLFLRKMLKINSRNADRIYLIIFIAAVLIISIIGHVILMGLESQMVLLQSIPNKIINLE